MNKSKSNSGFGIIEILIAFGLVGILTAVMTTLFTNIQKQQRQTNMITSINSLRETISKTITDGRAWENTINNGINRLASTNCLVNRTPCTHTVTGAAPIPPTNAFYDAAPFENLPILLDAGNVPNPIIRALPTTGYTLNGTPCDTYIAPPAAGNDACPFRWTMRMQFVCPLAAATCVDPSIRVIAMLNYNPNPASGLAVSINPSKYILVLTRGARGENRSEQMVYSHQAAGAGQGGGTCTPNAWRNIPLGLELVDEGNNGVLNVGTGVVTFQPGTYNCTATASCFSCRSLMMGINVGGVRTPSPGSVGPEGTMLNVSVSLPDIRINAPTPVVLEHFCSSAPVCAVCPANYGMGMAVPDYAVATRFSSLTCTRVF